MVKQMTQPLIRPTRTTITAELAEWCRNYHFNNPWPADFSKRFAIAVYQIWTGLDWRDGLNKAEAFCATSLHLLMVCEALELNWAGRLPEDLMSIEYNSESFRDYRVYLLLLSRSQQMILYASQAKGIKGTVKTGRTSRYKPDELSKDLCKLIYRSLSWVHPIDRHQGIEDACENMTKRI